MKQPILYLLCGPAASGKSTWCKQHIKPGETYISRDEIRFSMLKSNDSYFEYENQVFNQFIQDINRELAAGHNVYADATHLNWKSRNKTLQHIIGKDTIQIVPIVMNTPFYLCLERNAKRSGRQRVPDVEMSKMFNRFTFPTQDNFNYDDIIFVD